MEEPITSVLEGDTDGLILKGPDGGVGGKGRKSRLNMLGHPMRAQKREGRVW